MPTTICRHVRWLLAVIYELREITARLIEIGSIVENFNRRALRATIKDHDDDDFASESIIKTQRVEDENQKPTSSGGRKERRDSL